MITLLLAFVNFVITVALHAALLSIKLAIEAFRKGAKSVKAGVKKSTDKVKADVRDIRETSESNAKEQLNKRNKFANAKERALRTTEKALKTALNLSRFCLILVVCFIFVFGTLMVTTSLALVSSAGYVALAYDNGNLDGTDTSFDITKDVKGEEEDSKTEFVKGDTSTIAGKLEYVANWYIKNVPDYSQSKSTTADDSLINGMKCRHDCTGFAKAFACYVVGSDSIELSWSQPMVQGNWNATKHGWTYYETMDLKSLDDLQTGDILVANDGNSSKGGTHCLKGNHAEVFVDKKHQFGWGWRHTSYPYAYEWKLTKNNQGRTVVEDKGHMYVCFYRYTGGK